MSDEHQIDEIYAADNERDIVAGFTDQELGLRWQELTILSWLPELSSDETAYKTGFPVDNPETRRSVVVEEQAFRWREFEAGREIEDPRTVSPQVYLKLVERRLGFWPDDAPRSYWSIMPWVKHVYQNGPYEETDPKDQIAIAYETGRRMEMLNQREKGIHENKRKEVIAVIKNNFGGDTHKIRQWMKNTEIPSFHATADQLIMLGRHKDLMRYLKRLKDGGYA